MIFTVFVAVLAVLGCLLEHRLDKNKHKKLRKIIIYIILILTPIVVFWSYFRQEKESKKEFKRQQKEFETTQKRFDEIKHQNDFLISKNDSLNSQLDKMRIGQEQIQRKLEPFMQIAQANYPALSEDEALNMLATHVSQTLDRMQPKVICLTDKTEFWKDSNTSLIHNIYYFRSQYPISLRDISIIMRFDGTILRAEGKIVGAFVVEQGSRMIIDIDSKGFAFVTGFLGVGNDIKIEVISNEPLMNPSIKMSPP